MTRYLKLKIRIQILQIVTETIKMQILDFKQPFQYLQQKAKPPYSRGWIYNLQLN
jgi:hypothetical protein